MNYKAFIHIDNGLLYLRRQTEQGHWYDTDITESDEAQLGKLIQNLGNNILLVEKKKNIRK